MPRCLMAKKWKAYPWPDRAEEQPTAEQELDSTASTTTSTSSSLHTVPSSPSAVERTSSSSSSSSSGANNDTTSTSSPPSTVAPECSQPQGTSQGTVELVEEDEEIDVVGDSPAAATATAASSKSTGSTVATCWGPSSPTAGATAPSPPPHSPEAATRESTILYNGEFHVFVFNYRYRTVPERPATTGRRLFGVAVVPNMDCRCTCLESVTIAPCWQASLKLQERVERKWGKRKHPESKRNETRRLTPYGRVAPSTQLWRTRF
uniref:Uncharacterized protein n=1 Tax=Anopheles culicifacies TaxID=139723 RepID=A0A182LT08_9DIPT